MRKIALTVQDIIEWRDKWCTHLKSGLFAQTTSQLANKDYTAFCCLGVAEETIGCDLPAPFTITRAPEGYEGYMYANSEPEMVCYYHGLNTEKCDDDCDETWENGPDDLEESTLHPELRRCLGLTKNQENTLICLNDDDIPFAVIADVIFGMWIHLDGVVYSNYGFQVGTYDLPREDQF